MSERFFFLHIPKTAGMTLHRLLEQAAGPYLHLRHPHELRWPASLVWDRFRGCGGHQNWALAKRKGFLDGFTLTFLREPFERILSQFDFSRLPALYDQPDAILVQHQCLRDILRKTAGHFNSFWNAQTFALSGLPDHSGSPEAHLESALNNLEKCAFVGTTETLAEDAADLVQLLGGPSPLFIPHENRTHRHSRLDTLNEETLALLAETQALDQILYNRARELRTGRNPHTLDRQGRDPTGWPPAKEARGAGGAEITRVEICAADGRELRPGGEAEIFVYWVSQNSYSALSLGLAIEDVLGNYIAGTNTLSLTRHGVESAVGASCGSFRFRICMGAGRYVVDVALHCGTELICWLASAAVFEVLPKNSPYREGMVDLDATFKAISPPITEPLSEQAARQVALSLETTPIFKHLSGEAQVLVRLVNKSRTILSSTKPTQLYASYHWVRLHGEMVLNDGSRTNLPHSVWPQEDVRFYVRINPPPEAGVWLLQVRLVQEGVRWFEGPGFDSAMPPDLQFDFQTNRDATLMAPPCGSH